MSKLNKNNNFLWQKPRQGRIHYTDTEWYENRRVGRDLLDRFMQYLHKNIMMEGHYMNHSIRATVITMLDNCGFEARHIMGISSHKSESTIKEYSVKCPTSKRKEMFDSLSNAILPKKSKPSSTVSKPPPQNKENNTPAEKIPDIQEVKQNLPNFTLTPIEEFATIDDNILSELLNDNFEIPQDANANQNNNNALVQLQNPTPNVPQTMEQNPTKSVPNPTINTQVNTINVPSHPMYRFPQMYFPNSSHITINYNYNMPK